MKLKKVKMERMRKYLHNDDKENSLKKEDDEREKVSGLEIEKAIQDLKTGKAQ